MARPTMPRALPGLRFHAGAIAGPNGPEEVEHAAIVDRVTFNAHILETGTNSYRLRTTKTRTRPKTT